MKPPFHQNDLDSLCGFMCIMNAMAYLYPNDFHSNNALSTTILVKALKKLLLDFNKIWEDGMHLSIFIKLLKKAEQILKENNYKFSHTNLINLSEFIESSDQLWSILKILLDSDDVCAIVWFEDPEHHLTVVTHLDEKYVHFYDSNGIRKIKRSGFTFGKSKNKWTFATENIFILKR